MTEICEGCDEPGTWECKLCGSTYCDFCAKGMGFKCNCEAPDLEKIK